jgi:PST family polysaccharide transporter
LTSIQSVLAAFAIILTDLLGRAGLDKVLALVGGPALVAHWAQLQSVVELVSTVALAGVLQGLTVLIAQVRESRGVRSLLRAAFKLGMGTSLAVALGVMLMAGLIRGEIKPELFLLAALAGWITVIPATLNAYWLGQHQQQRMLGLALLTSAVLLLVAVGAWFGMPLRGLMLMQCFVLVVIGSVIWRYLCKLSGGKQSRAGDGEADETQYLRRLVNFVPVGLAIGIMSPVSMLLIRGTLADSLSWNDVGFLQALWRSTEWVTATAAGVLSLVFLPRFSATYGSARFRHEMMRAGLAVLIPAACLLLLIYFNQRTMLATLYDARFAVSDVTAALFMLGSWTRIASWLFLFGLFAAHRTRLIMAGEVLSLPLYALMLWLFADRMTLERTALLYLASYIVYLGFTAVSLMYSSRDSTSAQREVEWK